MADLEAQIIVLQISFELDRLVLRVSVGPGDRGYAFHGFIELAAFERVDIACQGRRLVGECLGHLLTQRGEHTIVAVQ